MKCAECVARDRYKCNAGFTSILINGALGCHDAERVFDAFHFNAVLDKTTAGTQTAFDVTSRLTGKWLDFDDTERFCAKCSICGNVIDTRFGTNFCPVCGADMR